MKRNLIVFFLGVIPCLVFGQHAFSKDVYNYIKNEKDYNKKSYQVVKDVLENNNKQLSIDSLFSTFKIVPTFRIDKKYLTTNIDSLMLNLKMDKNILWDEILIIDSPNKNFSYFVGFTLCEWDILDLCLYDYSPEKFNKHKKGVEKFVIGSSYDLIFKIDNYPDFWFMWKDNQLSLYSFLNETLYEDKKEIQQYLDKNPITTQNLHKHNATPCHKIVTVVNKTNKEIYLSDFYDNSKISVEKITVNPLTGWSKVLANETSTAALYYGDTCFEHLLYPINEGIMTVFIFDVSTLETKGWDYIKANDLFIKRYDLTLKDLNNMNWTITYDGN